MRSDETQPSKQFADSPPLSTEYTETQGFDQVHPQREYVPVDEFGDRDSTIIRDGGHSKGRSMSLSLSTAGVTSAVAVVAVVAIVAASGTGVIDIFGDQQYEAEMQWYAVTSDSVSYSIVVEGLSTDDTIVVKVGDGRFIERTLEFHAPSGDQGTFVLEGTASGLKPGMDYSIVASVGNVNILDVGFVTDDTAFQLLDAECTCTVDGCFHVTVLTNDMDGRYGDFVLTLEDSFGNTVSATVTDHRQPVHIPLDLDSGTPDYLGGEDVTLTVTCQEDGVGTVTLHTSVHQI